jgi:hypothetical protein
MTRTEVVLAVTLVCVDAAAAAGAATITTGANCSLVDAITSANTNPAVGGCVAGSAGPDTIVTGAVTLTAPNNGVNGLPVITEDLRITSPDPAITSFITRDSALGTPEFRLLEIGTANDAPVVTLARIWMENGKVSGRIVGGFPAAGAGGCIFLRNGSLTIVDSVVQECSALGLDDAAGRSADAWGGGVAAVAGTLVIRNSSLGFNRATGGAALAAGFPGAMGDGGAIFATGLDSLVIERSNITSNVATGGAGVTRAGNGRGGGLIVFGTETRIVRSSLSANVASGGVASGGTGGMAIGGGVFAEAGPALTMTDSELTGNVADGPDSPAGPAGYAFGGGLYADAITLTLSRSDITDNRATGGAGPSSASNGIARGGGLYVFDAPTTADRLHIEENTITGYNPKGGGIAFLQEDAAAPLLLTRSTLASNAASATHDQADGGGLYQDGDTVTIRTTSFDHNSADLGGGLFQETGTATVTLSTFSNNTADAGGAVAVDGAIQESNTVKLTNVTISGQHRRRRRRRHPGHRPADFTRRDHRPPEQCDRDRQHQRRRPTRVRPLGSCARDGQQHHRRAGERRRLRDQRDGKPHEQRRQSRERHELRLHRGVRPAIGRRPRPRRDRQQRRPDPHARPSPGLARDRRRAE